MHEEILSAAQATLAETVLADFPNFYLCGGTALAPQIGHRKSIDFDLATSAEIKPEAILRSLQRKGLVPEHTLTTTGDELTIIVQGVKLTLFPSRSLLVAPSNGPAQESQCPPYSPSEP